MLAWSSLPGMVLEKARWDLFTAVISVSERELHLLRYLLSTIRFFSVDKTKQGRDGEGLGSGESWL